jgi:hypothetical protein
MVGGRTDVHDNIGELWILMNDTAACDKHEGVWEIRVGGKARHCVLVLVTVEVVMAE